MIERPLAWATALGLTALSLSGCSSHVDVGFTSEGGVPVVMPDAGDASRANQGSPGDATDARGPACTFTRSCINGICRYTQLVPAPWCTGICASSIDICEGECVDRSSDSNHCGRCSTQCSALQTCVMGDCRG